MKKCAYDGCVNRAIKGKRLCSSHRKQKREGILNEMMVAPPSRVPITTLFSEWEIELIKDDIRWRTMDGVPARTIGESYGLNEKVVLRLRSKLQKEGRLPKNLEIDMDWAARLRVCGHG